MDACPGREKTARDAPFPLKVVRNLTDVITVVQFGKAGRSTNCP
jgi:hypothetical protein